MKKHNSKKHHKTITRQRVAKLLKKDASILEFFCGEGFLYNTCWHEFCGVTIDKVEKKIKDAAKKRPNWYCYCGDTKRSLENGWMNHRSFDLIDVDAFGEPWPFLKAFLSTKRKFKPQWWLVLTDGYWPQRNMAKTSKTLFGAYQYMSGITSDQYIEKAISFVKNTLGEKGIIAGSHHELSSNKTAGVGQHVFLIQDSKKETIELEALRSW